MTDLQGAVGLVQLNKLDKFINDRDNWANYYRKELSSIPWLSFTEFSRDFKHGWQSFVLLIDETKSPYSRNKIMEILQEAGISTRPGTHAVHMLDFYAKRYKIKSSDFPFAELANNKSISIPLHNNMKEEDFKYVIHHIKNIN